MKEKFVKLTINHKIKNFNCGDNDYEKDLTNFLFTNAKPYLQEKMGVTYIIENAHDTITYCTILNDKISMSVDEKQIWNRLNRKIANEKRRKSYPAMKIGCLATNKDYKKSGYASAIVDFITKHLLSDEQFSGCRFLTVEAYNKPKVIKFYTDYGFKFISEKDSDKKTRCMYLDIAKEQEQK